jgi:hypothetical protein
MRKKAGERHIRLYHWILRTSAWEALKPNDKAVLIDIWARHNGANNGQIVYSASEAQRVGLSKATGARVLLRLIELGFLRVTRQSAFRIKTKEAREWALTMEPAHDRPPTKDFARWTPVKPGKTGTAAKPASYTKNGQTAGPFPTADHIDHQSSNLKHGLTRETHGLTRETETGKPAGSNGFDETRLPNVENSVENSDSYGLETAKNTKSHSLTRETVNPPDGLTHETLLVIPRGAASKEPGGGVPPAGGYAANRLPLQFGDEAKARRTRRMH